MQQSLEEIAKGVVLVVDDDPTIRFTLSKTLSNFGYKVIETGSGEAALDILQKSKVDVVVLDVVMPGIDGIETCRRIRNDKVVGHIPVIFVTALSDKEARITGKKVGADDFLVKPIENVELLARVHNLMMVRRYYEHLEAERTTLKRTVNEQSDLLGKAITEIGRATRALHGFHEEIVFRLSKAIEFRDDETGNHVQRMSRYCELIGRKLGMPEQATEAIRIASPLHDVGKIAMPDNILRKPSKLDDSEVLVMRRHSFIGREILSGSASDLLELAATIAWTHHEKFDGSGYPERLSGNQIPIEGRIAAVADVFDALTSKRVYKKAVPVDEAIEYMKAERGSHFDPKVVDAFLSNEEEIKSILLVYADR